MGSRLLSPFSFLCDQSQFVSVPGPSDDFSHLLGSGLSSLRLHLRNTAFPLFFLLSCVLLSFQSGVFVYVHTSFASNSLLLTMRRIVISLAVFIGKVSGTGTQSNCWSETDTGGQVQLTLGFSKAWCLKDGPSRSVQANIWP